VDDGAHSPHLESDRIPPGGAIGDRYRAKSVIAVVAHNAGRAMACNLLDDSAGRREPGALTHGGTLVLDMSVYRKLDEGIPSEINVNDLARPRDASGALTSSAPKITLPPQPAF